MTSPCEVPVAACAPMPPQGPPGLAQQPQPGALPLALSNISHARVLAIAAPIVLSNLTVPLLGLVNTGVIGQLGQAAPIGAVGLGAVVLASLYWPFGFLRMGTTGLAAQAIGRGDAQGAAAVLWRGLGVAVAIGGVLIALQWLLITAALTLSPASAEVEALARGYMAIRIWAAPATIALYAINGFLIAQGRSRAILLLQLVMNGLNIGLDLLFVLGLRWGVPGVAGATLIAEGCGMVLGLWLVRQTLAHRPPLGRLLARHELAQTGRVNADIMVRSIALQACVLGFLFWGAAEGDVALAANQVLMQFMELSAYVLDGFAFAAEALVGQAVGARLPALVRRASRLSCEWALLGAVILAAITAVMGPLAIDSLTTAPEVRAAARQYLPWLVALPPVALAGWMLDGIFVGATLSREMRNVAVLSALCFGALAVLLQPLWGNHGLWAALLLFYAVRSFAMALFYPRAEAKARL